MKKTFLELVIQKNINIIIIELMSQWMIGPNGTTFIILLQHCRYYKQLEDIWTKILNYELHNNKKLQEKERVFKGPEDLYSDLMK